MKLRALAIICFWYPCSVAYAQNELVLEPAGEARNLPERLLGASVAPFYEHLLDDPKKLELVKEMHLAYVRFSGGSDANYYDWRTGLFSFPVQANSSAYMRFWGEAGARIARGQPNGVRMTEFKAFADAVGAEVVLVPNLETSSVEEQAAWFKEMASRGEVSHHLELGNEFWIAMGGDPNVEKRWPDEETSADTVHKYLDAFSQYLPKGAKVAWQAAGDAQAAAEHPRSRFHQRLVKWDEDLRPKPWFDAVTVHEYPHIKDVLGVPLEEMPRGEEGKARIFRAMMARCDGGTDRVLRDVEARVPGKEIWVTEWNSRGVDHTVLQNDSPVTPPMVAQLTARTTFSFLAHRSVTASLFFMVNFNGSAACTTWYSDGKGEYRQNATTAVLRWFNEAANGGAEYQAYKERKAKPVAGGGRHDEGYLEVLAGSFRRAKEMTMLIQNASPEPRSLDPNSLQQERAPKEIEVLALPVLTETADDAPQIQEVQPAEKFVVPPHSIARIRWE